MKKFMLGLAIAAVGSAFAVESSNIVGYLNKSTVQGKTFQGPMFVAIGTGCMSDLKVTGYSGDVDSEMVTVSHINQYGVNTKDLIWLDVAEADIYGWYQWDGESDPVDCNSDPLSAGEGLMVQVDGSAVGWTITFPPAVAPAD